MLLPRFICVISLLHVIMSFDEVDENSITPRSLSPVTSTACSTWVFKQIKEINKFNNAVRTLCDSTKSSTYQEPERSCSQCFTRRMNKLYYLEGISYVSTICLAKAKECPGFNAAPLIEGLQAKLANPKMIFDAFQIATNISRKEFEYDVELPSDFIFPIEIVEHTEMYITFRIKSNYPTPVSCNHNLYVDQEESPELDDNASRFFLQSDNNEGVLVSENFQTNSYDGKTYKFVLKCSAVPYNNMVSYKTFELGTFTHSAGSITIPPLPSDSLADNVQNNFKPESDYALTSPNPKLDIQSKLTDIENAASEEAKINLVKTLVDFSTVKDIIPLFQTLYSLNEGLALINCQTDQCYLSLQEIQTTGMEAFLKKAALNRLISMINTKQNAEQCTKLFSMVMALMFNKNAFTINLTTGKKALPFLSLLPTNLNKLIDTIKKNPTTDSDKSIADIIKLTTIALNAAISYIDIMSKMNTYLPYSARTQLMTDPDLILLKNSIVEFGAVYASNNQNTVDSTHFKYRKVTVPTTRLLQAAAGYSDISFTTEGIKVSIPVDYLKTALGGYVDSVGVIIFLNYPLLSEQPGTTPPTALFTKNVVSVEAYNGTFFRIPLSNLTEAAPLVIEYTNPGFSYCNIIQKDATYTAFQMKKETVGNNLICKTTVFGETMISKKTFEEEKPMSPVEIGQIDPPSDPEKPEEPVEPDTPIAPPGDNNGSSGSSGENLWWISLIVLAILGLAGAISFFMYKYYFKGKQDTKKLEVIDTGRSVNTVNTVGIELSSKPVEGVNVARSQFNPVQKPK